jgi:glycosyltransferase involved in cell wall biosynthesis
MLAPLPLEPIRPQTRPRIAIYPGGLDCLSVGSGQYRYVVDLVRTLHEMQLPLDFVVLGARAEPAPDIASVFHPSNNAWHYRFLPHACGRGSFYLRQARLAHALWGERIDLCHCLHSAIPLLAPCPVVATQHDMMFELFPEYAEAVRSRPYRITRWTVRRRVHRVICVSQTTADDLGRLWRVNASRLDVVHHGTSFATLGRTPGVAVSLPPTLQNLGNGPVLVSPYNLEPRKNLGALLEALARLRPAHSQLMLVLFGGAALTSTRELAFRQHVRRLGLDKNVLLTGPLSDEQLAWLYRKATALVFPSLYEGFGLPVLEAMAAGACVIARGASAMAEVVGEAGVLVETQNPIDLANAIAMLLRDEDRRTRLAAAAKKRAALFTLQRMARQTYECYRKALGLSSADGKI